MPIHNSDRVTAGTFHAFHVAWIAEIQIALNGGILPPDYYAQAEQIAGPLGPDVLTLQTPDVPTNGAVDETSGGGIAVATARPRVRWSASLEMNEYSRRRRSIVIRHSSGDRIVALIEIVSPGNKSSQHGLWTFVEKALESLYRGYHLLLVDLFPPGPRDPQGIHGVIWEELGDPEFVLPPDEPLTLAAYSAGTPKTAYVEPTAVGQKLIDMPLFLDPDYYVNVPLEATYQAAYRGVPRRWRQVLE